jgi:hypothetical protein
MICPLLVSPDDNRGGPNIAVKYDSAFSPRDAPEVCSKVPPSSIGGRRATPRGEQGYPKRGAGNAGRPMRPQPRVQR